MSLVDTLDGAVHTVQEQTATIPAVGLVLGSGLGSLADSLACPTRIPYADIPSMPVSSVAGHAGNLCIGSIESVPVACLQGRVHMYEGHPVDRVVFGVRLLARLGCRAVLVTNAAGGMRPSFRPGDLMLIVDHLNLTGHNPLVGPDDQTLGPRFVDMTAAYDRQLNALAQQASRETGVRLRKGVYAGLLGPSYETPAEVSMLRKLGADAVGMSTVCEVVALRQMGVAAAAISCITNLAAGLSRGALSHAEVQETATMARARFETLLRAWIQKVGRFVSDLQATPEEAQAGQTGRRRATAARSPSRRRGGTP